MAKRLLGGATAAFLALGLVAFPGVAFAADDDDADATGWNVPIKDWPIDQIARADGYGGSTTGSITIVKLEKPETGSMPHGGTELSPVPGVPIPGVTFEICPIYGPGSDLETGEGALSTIYDLDWWLWAAQLDPENGGVDFQYNYLECQSDVTDENGTLKIENLPYGLYLINEQYYPTDVLEDRSPFLVTIPMLNPEWDPSCEPGGNSCPDPWLDDIYVYPKNEKVHITKVVDDTGAFTIGDEVRWTITAAVPTTLYSAFEIRDWLGLRLEYKSI
ncbi:MAG: SpaH/EbpB family LPXTG-anchored major pilin [Promicromonosporaceae bacterium]|nr:SpaH/EbpB family LPXTG-anchored major pilin [Promicromonosporaceae bacterium]